MVNPTDKKLDQIIADARNSREEREKGYRAQALKMFPHVCGRCSREFNRSNLHELTVHHRDHNHDNNPVSGENWELLCMYCHDNEHQRRMQIQTTGQLADNKKVTVATHKPFTGLAELLKNKKND